jgi:hypothetical protein
MFRGEADHLDSSLPGCFLVSTWRTDYLGIGIGPQLGSFEVAQWLLWFIFYFFINLAKYKSDPRPPHYAIFGHKKGDFEKLFRNLHEDLRNKFIRISHTIKFGEPNPPALNDFRTVKWRLLSNSQSRRRLVFDPTFSCKNKNNKNKEQPSPKLSHKGLS